jgi:hypothetical protein
MRLSPELSEDLRSVLKSAPGRRVLWKLFEASGLLGLSLVPGDALATAYNEGRRSIGLGLKLALDEASPDGFVNLMDENQRSDYVGRTESDPDRAVWE